MNAIKSVTMRYRLTLQSSNINIKCKSLKESTRYFQQTKSSPISTSLWLNMYSSRHIYICINKP